MCAHFLKPIGQTSFLDRRLIHLTTKGINPSVKVVLSLRNGSVTPPLGDFAPVGVLSPQNSNLAFEAANVCPEGGDQRVISSRLRLKLAHHLDLALELTGQTNGLRLQR